jgi:putative serine protease PepD
VIAALAAVSLLFAGVAGALIAGGGEQEQKTPDPLPAASGSTVPRGRIGAIYAAVAPGVVQVRTDSGSGTGFVIKDDGTIVTNFHVVDGVTSAKVIFDDSGKPVDAKVLGTDQSSDIAVLKVDGSKVSGIRPLALADSDAVKVGDATVAIGYPLGLDRTVTSGIVSGLGREIQAPNGFSIDKVIQTDAPINPGNSGGPLLDEQGRVIGVNSQIASSGMGNSGNIGIGFAVPSNLVRQIVPKLELGQKIDHAYLGVSTGDSPTGNGAIVREVNPGTPAAKAGLKASSSPTGSGGDLIVAIDGRPVTSPDDVIGVVAASKPGDKIKVTVIRDGRQRDLTVTLGSRPEKVPQSP